MSTRAPQRCIKCSDASGTVIYRRGHQCPFAAGSGSTAVISATLPSVAATTEPSVSFADVHQFDVGAISDLFNWYFLFITFLDEC